MSSSGFYLRFFLPGRLDMKCEKTFFHNKSNIHFEWTLQGFFLLFFQGIDIMCTSYIYIYTNLRLIKYFLKACLSLSGTDFGQGSLALVGVWLLRRSQATSLMCLRHLLGNCISATSTNKYGVRRFQGKLRLNETKTRTGEPELGSLRFYLKKKKKNDCHTQVKPSLLWNNRRKRRVPSRSHC